MPFWVKKRGCFRDWWKRVAEAFQGRAFLLQPAILRIERKANLSFRGSDRGESRIQPANFNFRQRLRNSKISCTVAERALANSPPFVAASTFPSGSSTTMAGMPLATGLP